MTEIRSDFSKLEEFEKQLKELNNTYVKIGILSQDASRTDGLLSNVQIGYEHEFGGFFKDERGEMQHIPQRSFLRMPLNQKSKSITSAATKIFKKYNASVTHKLSLLGIFCTSIIHEAFSSGGFGNWQELSPSTIKRKKHSQILKDTLQLERAISYQVEKNK